MREDAAAEDGFEHGLRASIAITVFPVDPVGWKCIAPSPEARNRHPPEQRALGVMP